MGAQVFPLLHTLSEDTLPVNVYALWPGCCANGEHRLCQRFAAPVMARTSLQAMMEIKPDGLTGMPTLLDSICQASERNGMKLGKWRGSMNRPRVLLADDHTLLLEAFQKLLESAYDVVGAVGDGQALLDAAPALKRSEEH